MKVIFMGTPDFASNALQAIIDAGHEIMLVVTQPDREKGRGKEVSFTPVKECALKAGIEVFQPVRIKSEEAVAKLREYEADIYVVAAFGQILSQEILDIPRYGCVNIHASLLPRLRGAAPIQWSILDGDLETGVTIMQMNAGLDTGDILMQKKIELNKEYTGESLFDALSDLGADAIVEALPLIEKGALTPVPQNEEESTYAKMLKKDMGRIDWTWDAAKIERYVRGLNSWPSAFTYINGKQLKIWEADDIYVAANEYVSEYDLKPGMVYEVGKEYIDVMCGEGLLRIKSLQLEGKKRMDVKAFLLGYKISEGDILG